MRGTSRPSRSGGLAGEIKEMEVDMSGYLSRAWESRAKRKASERREQRTLKRIEARAYRKELRSQVELRGRQRAREDSQAGLVAKKGLARKAGEKAWKWFNTPPQGNPMDNIGIPGLTAPARKPKRR